MSPLVHLPSPSTSSSFIFLSSTSSLYALDLRRCFSRRSDKELSHVDGSGQSRMVDVGQKKPSVREASAKAIVHVGPEVASLINKNEVKKGDVLAVARLAGIMAAKRTSDLIPLCHNIVLSCIDVNAQLDSNNCDVVLISNVRCVGQTGVEMEALTAATVAALTIYDMCKAITHDISIREVHLLKKTGGKSSDYIRSTN